MSPELIDTVIMWMWVAAGLAACAAATVGIWTGAWWSEVLALASVFGLAGGGVGLVVSGMFLGLGPDFYPIVAFRGLILMVLASVLSAVLAAVEGAGERSGGALR